MIQTRSDLSSVALTPVGARSNFIASAAHYEAVARRIVAAVRSGSRPLVLVTGDPPTDPQILAEALDNVAGARYSVIVIPCGPELKREDLERTVPKLAKPKDTSAAAAQLERPGPASPLFVFDDCDRLSDEQIEDVYQATLCRDQMWPAVLLAPLDFPSRLERSALHFLKDRIAGQFRFQEVGDDEAIAFLHNQLLSQRDRRAEARGFRHGILTGLAAGGFVIAASVGAFILRSTTEQVCEAPATTGQSSSVNEKVSMLRPGEEAATSAAPTQATPNVETTFVTATAPPPTSAPPSPRPEVEAPPAVALPSVEHSPASPRLSAAEITALLARGDGFLNTGDITSARLFYERAADAESGLAALRLGVTFDPGASGRAGSRPMANPAQALFWYQRARQLGVDEGEQRIKALETRPSGG